MVLGQTRCGKTSFVQSLGKNEVFGSDLLSVDWIFKINLTKNFSYTKVEFHYPNDVEDLNLIIQTFQKKTYDKDKKTKDNNSCNIFGENKKFDKPIVRDKVSGLADKSNDFANFLTLSRKFFHIIYPTKST